MIFVISLIFTALFFSIQKIYAYDDCGDQAQWGEDCDAEEMMCLMIDPLGMEPWGYPAGDSTSGCWSGMCCGDDSDE